MLLDAQSTRDVPSSLVFELLKFLPVKQEAIVWLNSNILVFIINIFSPLLLTACTVYAISDGARSCQLETWVFTWYFSEDMCSLLLSTCYCWLGENLKCVIDWILMNKIKVEEREPLNALLGFYGKCTVVSFDFVYCAKWATSQTCFVWIWFMKYV